MRAGPGKERNPLPYGFGMSGVVVTPLLGFGMSGVVVTPLLGFGMSGVVVTPLFGFGMSGVVVTPLLLEASEIAKLVDAITLIVITSDRKRLSVADIGCSFRERGGWDRNGLISTLASRAEAGIRRP